MVALEKLLENPKYISSRTISSDFVYLFSIQGTAFYWFKIAIK